MNVSLMASLTNDELFELTMMYALCNRNNAETAREFARKYPHLPQISRMYVFRMMRRLRTTASFQARPRPGRNHLYTQDNKFDILAFFSSYPHASVRAASTAMGLPKSCIAKILHRYSWHPFSILGVQSLQPSDYSRRLDFCNWLLIQQDLDPSFVKNILWTDECKFTEDGTINTHNDHYWNNINPFFVRETHHQQKFAVSVWCGIWNGQLVGPVLYEGNLTTNKYLEIILNGAVTDLIETTLLCFVKNMYFQQDGAPAHQGRHVTNWLNINFGNQWIGLRGDREWPPRSPDLTPLDFYLWGHLRQQVYATRPRTLAALKQKIIDVCSNVSVAQLNSIYRSIIRRAELCIGADGNHFEHLL